MPVQDKTITGYLQAIRAQLDKRIATDHVDCGHTNFVKAALNALDGFENFLAADDSGREAEAERVRQLAEQDADPE